ncbi:MAG: FAD-binding domain-containing protein [Pirellulales bacterium]
MTLPAPNWPTILPEAGGAPPSASTGRFRGGRDAALERLAAIDPRRYATTRNHVDGAVTGLSPWLRHGVLSLAEVRDAALDRTAEPAAATTLVRELAWRDYWQRVQAALGERIGTGIEAPAVPPRRTPSPDLPDDVRAATTGMPCIDDFVRRLHADGWLHNHERMWLASWLIHARGVAWQAGADWFLSHLLDGDPASNHLSWQWVAGTFSSKPYIFNRDNLETFTSGRHCRGCPLLGRCDVEGSYEGLADRWFLPGPTDRPPLRIAPAPPWRPAGTPGRRPLVWVTLDSAAASAPAVARHPGSPRVFVIDPDWLAAERPSRGRLLFLMECLAAVPGLEVLRGDPATVLPPRAAALGCDGVALATTSCPRLRRGAERIAASLPVEVIDWPPLVDATAVRDLGRFSRYWEKVSRSALLPTRRG